MANIHVGDEVRVKRNIYRLEEIKHLLLPYNSSAFQNGNAEEKIKAIENNLEIETNRKRILYAKVNDVGKVIAVFRHSRSGVYVQVKIDDNIKTLRITSVEKFK